MNALDYFLKANLYGLLFVGCYWLFLRRHTFFSVNRAYLLLSAVLSLVLPMASLPAQTVQTLPDPVPVGVIALPTATAVSTATVNMSQPNPGPDWEQVGLLAYGVVAVLLLLWVVVRVGRLVMLIRRSPRQMGDEGYVLVQPNNPGIPTFSFFGYMVLNPADIDNDLIINHELVHIRQYHSADVVGMALLRAMFWACPSLWLIDRMLRQVHEFLADAPASQPTDYARFLVEYTFGVRPDTLTNGFFNPSLLKQRIQMLRQRTTTRWALGKYALVIPLAFILLAMTTAREEIADIIQPTTDETITVSGRVTSASDGKPIPGAIVMVASTGKGIPTDAQGRFKLTGVSKTALLSVSFVGFTTMVIPLDNRTTVHVALAMADPNELPAMGATAVYKAIKPNPAMPIRTPPSSETINGQVYIAVEEPAVFPTGIPGLMQYVAHSLRYPAKAQATGVQGNVLVQFTVLPTGAIGSARIKRGIGSGCDEEALRIVRQMPRWIPGKQNGKLVATQHVLPILFALEKREDKRTGRIATPQPDSGQKTTYILDNSKNGRFALYNDVKEKVFARPDSNLPIKPRYDTANVTIRGAGPLGELGAEPLYIIDGVEVSKDSQTGKIKGLEPNKIESITVLKNLAAARATYGPKALYGVILITTKKK